MSTLLRRPIVWIATVALAASAVTLSLFMLPGQAAAQPITTVSVRDMAAALEAGALVLDVREPWEYGEGHVAGTVLVPLMTVAERADEFPKDQPIYVFCRSGNRSLVAAESLAAAGFTDVRNVDGGIIAWTSARLPVQR